MVSYTDKNNNINSISLWDNIIQNKNAAMFTTPDLTQKYEFWDVALGI